jgi:hypothetical protein
VGKARTYAKYYEECKKENAAVWCREAMVKKILLKMEDELKIKCDSYEASKVDRDRYAKLYSQEKALRHDMEDKK